MSPTVFRAAGFRFLFFSREESRIHIHVQGARGQAKFWLEPRIELAAKSGLSKKGLGTIQKLVEEHEEEIRQAWRRHLGR